MSFRGRREKTWLQRRWMVYSSKAWLSRVRVRTFLRLPQSHLSRPRRHGVRSAEMNIRGLIFGPPFATEFFAHAKKTHPSCHRLEFVHSGRPNSSSSRSGSPSLVVHSSSILSPRQSACVCFRQLELHRRIKRKQTARFSAYRSSSFFWRSHYKKAAQAARKAK